LALPWIRLSRHCRTLTHRYAECEITAILLGEVVISFLVSRIFLQSYS
jgi:hypothetical protein